MQDAVGPKGLVAGTSERRAVEDSGDEVFYAGIVDVVVRGEGFFAIAETEDGAVERIEIDFAFGADDAELVALDARVPADIDDGMDAGGILDEDCGGVFDGLLMDGVGEQAGGAGRLAEEEIHGVDAMAGGVEERAAAGHGGIEAPALGLIRRVVGAPFMTVGLGKDGLADDALGDELAGADELGTEAAVVSDGEETLMSAGGGEHRLRVGEIESGGFFAEDVLAGMQSGDGMGRMERDGRGDVDGVDGGGVECDVEVGEDLSAGVSGGLLRIAGDERLEAAARLRKNGGDDAAAGDIADSNDQPANHDVNSVHDFGGAR